MDAVSFRPLSRQAEFILRKLAAGGYVRSGSGAGSSVFVHDPDGTELGECFSYSTVTALETRGLAVRSDLPRGGFRWDITEAGLHQVKAWQE